MMSMQNILAAQKVHIIVTQSFSTKNPEYRVHTTSISFKKQNLEKSITCIAFVHKKNN